MTPASRTVLIVDDSPEDRELYRRYLLRDSNYSYTVQEATLGQQGLELWHQHRPDAVLLDYRLPDLDGLEFLGRLKSSTPEFCLPVIVITGQGNEAIAVQAMKAGAQDYLIKGQITPEGLYLAVNRVIEMVQLRTQLQQRIERERVIAQIAQQIYQSLHLDSILQTTVAEVRQFLHTDRVLVFQLKPDGNGTVIAESVRAEWPALLSSTILDPCLAEKYFPSNQPQLVSYDPAFVDNYVQPYRQGQVTAISDIRDGSLHPCHVELLAQFQVKANLVVPIRHEDKFWGLLIAHHCATTRTWQSLEIELLTELATQVSIALRQAELYKQAQDELAERQKVEAALQESRTQLQQQLGEIEAIYQNAPIGLNVLDTDLRFVRINQRLAEMNGYSIEAHLGRTIRELLPDLADAAEQILSPLLETGEPRLNMEIRGETPAQPGVPRIWVEHFLPLKDGDRVIGISTVCEEVTDRKRTEQALQDRELQFVTLAEASPTAIFRYDTASNCIYVNRRWCEMTGQPTEVALGMGWVQTLHPDDRDRLTREWLEWCANAKERGVYQNEGRWMRPDGRVLWFICQALPEINSDGIVVGYIGTITDITDRKQAEVDLLESEERFRTLADNMSQLAWMADEHGWLFWYNQRWFDYTGTNFEEMQGWGWQKVHHPDHVDQVVEHFRHCIETGELWEDTFPLRGQNGQYRWFLSRALPIRDQQGRILRWFGTNTDITERQQAAQERDRLLQLEQTARLEAERANRIKDEFLAILSHELRSPLNPILGWTKLLQTRKFDEAKTAEALATIERNAKLQTQLIDDLLDVAKILRGKLSMDSVPVNLAFVIESALDTVRTASVSKSIELHSVLPNLGQVSGDSGRLQQIVWNLLSNAIKFTPRGGRVEIRLERLGDQAQITVSDRGKGINPDFLPHIFESFRQEDVTTTRKYGGLGLGLAIVRSLVEAHGGTISAESPGEGQGATFTVQLPLLNVEPEMEQVDELSKQELDLTGIRVLTIDDETDVRKLYSVLLNAYGAEVLSVASAAEVLASLELFQPDVLVSDIGMPEVDGYTLLQQVRSLPPGKGGQIPAIAMTAYAREEDQQRCLAAGFQQHISKPIDVDRLVQAIWDLANQKQKSDEPEN